MPMLVFVSGFVKRRAAHQCPMRTRGSRQNLEGGLRKDGTGVAGTQAHPSTAAASITAACTAKATVN
jgi:hypothetical protein